MDTSVGDLYQEILLYLRYARLYYIRRTVSSDKDDEEPDVNAFIRDIEDLEAPLQLAAVAQALGDSLSCGPFLFWSRSRLGLRFRV